MSRQRSPVRVAAASSLSAAFLAPLIADGPVQRRAALDAEDLPRHRLGMELPVERSGVGHAGGPSAAVPRTLAVAPFGDAGSGGARLQWARAAARSAASVAPPSSARSASRRASCAFSRSISAGHVGRLGHHHDLVRPDLEEAADDRERLLRAALADAQLADAEHRHERRVVRQHPELALDARQDDRVDRVRVGEPLRRDDLEQACGMLSPPASRRSPERRRWCRPGRRPARAACRRCPRGSP